MKPRSPRHVVAAAGFGEPLAFELPKEGYSRMPLFEEDINEPVDVDDLLIPARTRGTEFFSI